MRSKQSGVTAGGAAVAGRRLGRMRRRNLAFPLVTSAE